LPNTGSGSWLGAPSRDYMKAGFFLALGVIAMIALAEITQHFLEAAVAVLAPFLVGIGVALLLDPLVRRLTRGKISRVGASIMVFVGFLLIGIALAYAAIPALTEQASNFATTGPEYFKHLNGTINDYLAKHHGKIGPVTVGAKLDTIRNQVTDKVGAAISASAGSIGNFLLGSATMVIQFVVALIVGFYALSDLDRLRARAYFLIPQKHRRLAGHLASDIGGVFSDYFRGLFIVCALYGVATLVLLYALSIKHPALASYALLVGAAAGVLYAVPYIGAITIALVTFLVAFAAGDLNFALLAVALTLGLNQVFDNIVTPKVVGGGVGLHPIMALFALAIGGELFQLWGLLLSVPVAASVQVILYRLFPKLSEPTPNAFLIAEGADPETEARGPKTGGGEAELPSDDVSPASKLPG